MNDYYVYIIRCSDGSLYTGFTSDLSTRLVRHHSGYFTTCYTCNRRPLKLVYQAHFHDVFDAINWEKRIKRWSRKKKLALIHGKWEELPMLSKKSFRRKSVSS